MIFLGNKMTFLVMLPSPTRPILHPRGRSRHGSTVPLGRNLGCHAYPPLKMRAIRNYLSEANPQADPSIFNAPLIARHCPGGRHLG
jgi:hypothetical protein